MNYLACIQKIMRCPSRCEPRHEGTMKIHGWWYHSVTRLCFASCHARPPTASQNGAHTQDLSTLKCSAQTPKPTKPVTDKRAQSQWSSSMLTSLRKSMLIPLAVVLAMFRSPTPKAAARKAKHTQFLCNITKMSHREVLQFFINCKSLQRFNAFHTRRDSLAAHMKTCVL